MSEEQQPDPNLAETPKRSGPRRRGHRGGRGRRRLEPLAPVSGPPVGNEFSVAAPLVEPPPEKFSARYSERREREADRTAISQAVAEVTEIVESLKQSLAQMEEVLELVELAERQKTADEHEIESLRRALHRLQRPLR